MRTALVLLMMLGVAAIPGSLIPQRTQNPMAVTAIFTDSPTKALWYQRFSLFDVYASPWFSAIYILLFISLIGCVLPRAFEHYKAARALPPVTPKNLSRMEFHSEWKGGGDELEIARQWFKKNRFRLRELDGSLSAEKGFTRETGNLFFHLALVLILIGVSFGSLFGMRGDAIVNVGERFINTPTTYDSLSFGKLFNEKSLPPFSIEIDKFVGKYDPVTNAPQDYTLSVTVKSNPESTPVKKIVKVNSPLTFGSTRVYLQANGYSPIVTVRDSLGNVGYQGPVPFLPQDANLSSTGAIKVPDTNPQLGFVGSFFPTIGRATEGGGISVFPEALDPRLFLAAWTGDLGLDNGRPQSIYRINTDVMKKIGLKSLAPGETFTFAEGSITFETYVPWVNLQVVRDPGKSYALLGGIVAILGLLASLFTRRRRIWVSVINKKVEIAGLAKNAAPGLELEITQLAKALGRAE
ncbi:MAG: cytochrome c biogenesis protein [Actinobacteria bacterium]|nr:cytochrome c biogenesis protein [Actinomycetota bacterium]